ncbi:MULTISPECIES: YtxH domain-containing protein [Arcicella]|uniref:YtxH domain-containing protein n=1 Tax=Arcicella lustrica TaxID=2984196 RepID=A0ABU5SEQ1_9BACT|nr:YtxH domain-containing protein [Arcicella sp. DC25W]MEA5425763.1 YtxH domain-containing protein [Arcicella sp. DC25W]|eukprot:PhF_6_TR11066/c0_g1_i1/m.17949
MSNNAKIIIGIAAAAAVGAAIGLVFAPEKGADLRKKVKKNANTWADELLTLIKKGENQAKGLVDDAENRARNWKNKAKDEFDEIAETATGSVKSIQRDVAAI